MIAREDFEFVIDDEAFAYLSIQAGSLDRLRGDRPAWTAAYKAHVFEIYESLVPFLPERCDALLDVGGGLGGIDALLNAHFGGEVRVAILDGAADPPVMRRHAETFSHMGGAERFLAAHGVRNFIPIRPAEAGLGAEHRFDLVVSFAAWCFHVPPDRYLGFVSAQCHPGSVLALEVRNGRPDWDADIAAAFEPASVIHAAPKFTRRVFVPRQSGRAAAQ